ncbi:hypothetical protein HDU91_006397, partial [Kappamyces sp. JEL0680]
MSALERARQTLGRSKNLSASKVYVDEASSISSPQSSYGSESVQSNESDAELQEYLKSLNRQLEHPEAKPQQPPATGRPALPSSSASNANTYLKKPSSSTAASAGSSTNPPLDAAKQQATGALPGSGQNAARPEPTYETEIHRYIGKKTIVNDYLKDADSSRNSHLEAKLPKAAIQLKPSFGKVTSIRELDQSSESISEIIEVAAPVDQPVMQYPSNEAALSLTGDSIRDELDIQTDT